MHSAEEKSRPLEAAQADCRVGAAPAVPRYGGEQPLFVGVDGGGTKTELLLCRRDGQILARCRTEGCNPNDIGLDPAFAILSSGIRRLLELGGAEEGQVLSLFAGLSGGATGDLQPRITRLLRAAFPQVGRVENDSDAVNILTAGLGAGDGCAVICGTGSACFVRAEGELHRIGGWGYLLDRYGSGYDIGRDAVIAALRQQDGRGGETLLTQLLEEKLGQPVPAAVSDLYRGGKRLLASFAPLVFAAAAAGDQAACGILDRNMEELAGLINAAGRLFVLRPREAPGEPSGKVSGDLSAASGEPSGELFGEAPGPSEELTERLAGEVEPPISPVQTGDAVQDRSSPSLHAILSCPAGASSCAASVSEKAGASVPKPFPVVLAGGIFANGEPVISRLTRCLTVPAQLRLLEVPPVWGAVYQAFVQAGVPLPGRLWEWE